MENILFALFDSNGYNINKIQVHQDKNETVN